MTTITQDKVMFRVAHAQDIDFIYPSLKDMAFEANIGKRFQISKAEFNECLFDKRLAEVIIAEINHVPVGLAMFSETNRHFALFKKSGLYLQDIYILPAYRKQGIATQLLNELRTIAKQRDYGRIDWIVLNSNSIGQQFYSHVNDAVKVDYFQCMRINLPAKEV